VICLLQQCLQTWVR